MKSIIMALAMMLLSSICFAADDVISLGEEEYSPTEIIKSAMSSEFIEDSITNGHGDRLYVPSRNFLSGIINVEPYTHLVWAAEYDIDMTAVKLTNSLHSDIRQVVNKSIMKSSVIRNFNIVEFNSNLNNNMMAVKANVLLNTVKVLPKGVTLRGFEILSINFEGEAL